MDELQLTLSRAEIQELLQFIDMGVRSNGLSVAQSGLSLAIKLQSVLDRPRE